MINYILVGFICFVAGVFHAPLWEKAIKPAFVWAQTKYADWRKAKP